jgi:hypothetical protein
MLFLDFVCKGTTFFSNEQITIKKLQSRVDPRSIYQYKKTEKKWFIPSKKRATFRSPPTMKQLTTIRLRVYLSLQFQQENSQHPS